MGAITWRGSKLYRKAPQGLVVGGLEGACTDSLHLHGPSTTAIHAQCMLGTRKADVVVRLHDTRLMAIECKVSNSATNSVKRLNNDAAAKAERWINQFGKAQVVPAAALAGVFKVLNLEQAQDLGLTLFWSHDLDQLGTFIESTR
ncbi:XamI family restriction endonuclease [Paracandidimonas lactea]|uniref:XamI family restriction endonuclease n=1 Tax=Paracandidimonas lactea TaxID=2895524 RepID=UPI0034E1CA35